MTKLLIGLAYACLFASGGVMFWMNTQGGRLHQLLASNANAAEPGARASMSQSLQSAVPTAMHMTAKPAMLDASQLAVLDALPRTSRLMRSSAAARGATLP